MINKLFNKITLTLLVLVGVGITGTFLSDHLADMGWFGDYQQTYKHYNGDKTYTRYYWGARHYWYNWGCFFLFVTALARGVFGVMSIVRENDKKLIIK